MATQESPVRINATLMAQAQAAAETFFRKPPEQIAHWANIGRLMESHLNAKEISALISGVASVKVVIGADDGSAKSQGVDLVGLAMSHQSEKGFSLARAEITKAAAKSKSKVQYQASTSRPGFLERISPDGTVDIGTFKNGKFRKAVAMALDV